MMARPRIASLGIAMLALWMQSALPGTAAGQELRIETDVFTEGEDEPLSHSITLFDGSTVYDFNNTPERIVIYRDGTPGSGGQFIVLDLPTERRTEISVEKINSLMDKVTRWAAEQEDPLLKFCSAPEFEESFDAELGVLDFTSDLWSYHVATIPADDPAVLARYRTFLDAYANLNAMMNNSPPPGPRMALNRALEKHGVVPVEVRRTLHADKSTLRAVHLVTWRLSRKDKTRLDEARRMLSTFQKVSNEEFVAQTSSGKTVRGQSHD